MGETSTKSKLELTGPKIIALIAILIVFREGIAFFWSGYNILTVDPNQGGLLIGIGLLEALLMAGILLIALLATIVDLKVEILKKLYNWIILLIVGIIVLIIELWGSNFVLIDVSTFFGIPVLSGAMQTGVLLGSMLVIAAALCELIVSKKGIDASLIVVLMGIVWLFIDSVILFHAASLYPAGTPIINNYIYYGVLGFIIGIYLLFIMQNKLDVKYIKLPYDWWTVLILGFIAFIWIHLAGVAIPVAGTLLMVGFILKTRE